MPRSTTLLVLLAVTVAGCADAERLLRDAAGDSGRPASGSSASGWPPQPASEPVDATGTWATDWGQMTLRQDEEGRVTGTYEGGASTIDAVNDGNVITGYWIEPSSTRDCGTTRNGSSHWGRATFVLVARSRWLGKYAYCDDTPDVSDADWNGTR